MSKNDAFDKKKQNEWQDLVFLEISILGSPDTKIFNVFDRQATF